MAICELGIESTLREVGKSLYPDMSGLEYFCAPRNLETAGVARSSCLPIDYLAPDFLERAKEDPALSDDMFIDSDDEGQDHVPPSWSRISRVYALC